MKYEHLIGHCISLDLCQCEHSITTVLKILVTLKNSEMGKDKRGVNRGSCQKCDCKEYEVYDKRLLCDYCGHRPVDHEVLKDDERPKRVSIF